MRSVIRLLAPVRAWSLATDAPGRALLATAMLALAACASVSPRPQLALPALRLAPASFGPRLDLQQRLTVTRAPDPTDDKAAPPPRTLDALLEIAPDEVRLAGFALGERVLTLRWDGERLQSTRSPMLPAEVDAAHVLRDVQMVYWPARAVRAVLPSGWTLAETAGVRCLQYRGTTEVSVHYASSPRWVGRAELNNRLEGYRMVIDSAVNADH